MTPKDVPDIFDVTFSGDEKSFTREGLDAAGINEAFVVDLLDVAKSHEGWVCEVDSKIVGFTMGNAKTGELWVIAVRPEHEKKGIGSELYNLVEKWLVSLGWNEIWLGILEDKQRKGYAFFKNRGWVDNGMNAAWRLMKKSMAKAA